MGSLKSDIWWSYIGYFLRICSNLIVLPIVVRKLDSDELGLWYVFLAIGSLAQLLDLGFAPTVMRNISYAMGGAKELKIQGLSDENDVQQGQPNYDLVEKLVLVSKKLYMVIATVAFLALALFGSWYVFNLSRDFANAAAVEISWTLFIFATSMNFYYSYWVPVLNGIGRINESQQAVSISQIIYVVAIYACLYMDLGLMAMAIGFLLSGFSLRILAKNLVGKYVALNTQQGLLGKNEFQHLFRILRYNALRVGAVSVGAYLILQSNIIISSAVLGLHTTASYGLTLQMFSALSSFSCVFFNSLLPRINNMQVVRNKEGLLQYFAVTVFVGWLVFSLGAVLLVFFGDWLMRILLHSQTALLSFEMMVFMSAYVFLEMNHGGLFAPFIITGNEVPFLKPALLSGVGTVLLSIFFVYYLKLGVWGLLLSQALVQLAYNNWKWPSVVLKEMDISLWKLLYLGGREFFSIVRRIVYDEIFKSK